MAKKRINWSTEKIMSTSALFISVISLIALLYQSYLAREENKLTQKQQSASVLPYLSQWISNSSEGFKIVVGNKGVGPAFIEKVELSIDSTYNFNNTDDLFAHIFETTKGMDTINYLTSTFKKGVVLPANETVELIQIMDKNHVQVFSKTLATKDLKFLIEYEDIYGARWSISNTNDTDVPLLLSDL
ncbi:MAG: hypothetical protein AAFX55_12835 [Bacteroidota bacterium]